MYYLKDEHGQQRNVEAVTEKEGIRTVYFYNSMMSSISIKETNGIFIYKGTAWTLEGEL